MSITLSPLSSTCEEPIAIPDNLRLAEESWLCTVVAPVLLLEDLLGEESRCLLPFSDFRELPELVVLALPPWGDTCRRADIASFDCDCSCYCLNQASLTMRTRGRAGKFPVGGETNRSQTATDVAMVIK